MPRIARRPVSELTGHLGYWLRQVSNHVSHAFARRLESRAVTVAEWAVLRALYAGEALAPSRLADQLGLTRAAISKLAERLVAKRLASRARNTSDGRHRRSRSRRRVGALCRNCPSWPIGMTPGSLHASPARSARASNAS